MNEIDRRPGLCNPLPYHGLRGRPHASRDRRSRSALPRRRTCCLPPRRRAHALQPLNAKSSLAEIRQRMLHSSEFWQTLWIQFQVLEFPPEGSNTMSCADRLQVWLQQPAEALLLLGCLGDCNPDYFLGLGRHPNPWS